MVLILVAVYLRISALNLHVLLSLPIISYLYLHSTSYRRPHIAHYTRLQRLISYYSGRAHSLYDYRTAVSSWILGRIINVLDHSMQLGM